MSVAPSSRPRSSTCRHQEPAESRPGSVPDEESLLHNAAIPTSGTGPQNHGLTSAGVDGSTAAPPSSSSASRSWLFCRFFDGRPALLLPPSSTTALPGSTSMPCKATGSSGSGQSYPLTSRCLHHLPRVRVSHRAELRPRQAVSPSQELHSTLELFIPARHVARVHLNEKKGDRMPFKFAVDSTPRMRPIWSVQLGGQHRM